MAEFISILNGTPKLDGYYNVKAQDRDGVTKTVRAVWIGNIGAWMVTKDKFGQLSGIVSSYDPESFISLERCSGNCSLERK